MSSDENTEDPQAVDDLDEAEAAEDPIVSGSSEASFEESMKQAQEAHDKAREEMDSVDLGDHQEVAAGEVDVPKEDVGKPGDPGTFLTEIEPAGDDTGDADPGQPGGDIPEDPAEATNAQNEQLRQERLDPANRADGAEVNNADKDYNPEIARFSESPEPEEELGPFE
ncbi:hypothetical protein KLP28_07000 [Nocardioidaceae bacterium]|nr:hypothetical protein KLP28_07000 [Nocardioidaceae bacterium]